MKPLRLFGLLLIIGLSCTTSCATYRWVHPTKTINEFHQDNSACLQQAAQAFPVTMIITTQPGYQYPSKTNCTGYGNQINCTTTPGYTTPPSTYSYDANLGNRNRALESCMNARGWTLQEVKSRPQASSNPSGGTLKDGVDAYNRRDYQTALKIFRPLAEQGDALAQNNLGLMYMRGNGLWLLDYPEALKWYTKSAEQGCSPGMAGLGDMYNWGWGVSQDYVEAYKWYILASSNPLNKEDSDRIIKTRYTLANKMTREQIAEAEKRASEWKPTK